MIWLLKVFVVPCRAFSVNNVTQYGLGLRVSAYGNPKDAILAETGTSRQSTEGTYRHVYYSQNRPIFFTRKHFSQEIEIQPQPVSRRWASLPDDFIPTKRKCFVVSQKTRSDSLVLYFGHSCCNNVNSISTLQLSILARAIIGH